MFIKDMRGAINANSMESGSDTPDIILAEFLNDCLAAFDKAVKARSSRINIPPDTSFGDLIRKEAAELENRFKDRLNTPAPVSELVHALEAISFRFDEASAK